MAEPLNDLFRDGPAIPRNHVDLNDELQLVVRDSAAEPSRARVLVRVERLATGNPGDVRPVGEGVSELRIDYGPGYRVYFKQQSRTIVVLLAGGDKRTQSRDIETALRLARNL